MATMMKKQVFSATSRRSAVVVQARRTVAKPSKSSTPDSLFYGPDRPQYLGPFSESACIAILFLRAHIVLACKY